MCVTGGWSMRFVSSCLIPCRVVSFLFREFFISASQHNTTRSRKVRQQPHKKKNNILISVNLGSLCLNPAKGKSVIEDIIIKTHIYKHTRKPSSISVDCVSACACALQAPKKKLQYAPAPRCRFGYQINSAPNIAKKENKKTKTKQTPMGIRSLSHLWLGSQIFRKTRLTKRASSGRKSNRNRVLFIFISLLGATHGVMERLPPPSCRKQWYRSGYAKKQRAGPCLIFVVTRIAKIVVSESIERSRSKMGCENPE
ncbi:hypothetical protein P153DRAFT_211624 [Dothidotthia symphoricarpi CBS 119687]|uniref:Uncharacterized protein n=1 Tax=Dothidotthia symphoricarpi CBS 119687 TaxID=1392245 RepID=A0A6A6AGR7_9PLEO|nr:uncharacterized protein P153DRAFT_211624 [Dothidotthia symphoricarpi CBS 119687]KAF2131129.1 hypothetical protein P153DRAFT_211624 [Dothidotthia symphoricarpi CBS 119687]